MKILESAENYLETILILQQRNGNVRAVEIAAELDFSKPSVSIAMKQLPGKWLYRGGWEWAYYASAAGHGDCPAHL